MESAARDSFIGERDVHSALVRLEIVLALITMIATSLVCAPYGRHNRAGWGPQMPVRAGWLLMECPAVIFFCAIYVCGKRRGEATSIVLLMMWLLHYVQRAVIFPVMLRGQDGKKMPVMIAVAGFSFNVLNAYINSRWISHLGSYDKQWLTHPFFLSGAAIFVVGYSVNLYADAILRILRKPGESDYKVPRGFLFEHVSSPNYAAEITEWIGWAIATCSHSGFAFAIYTVGNLGPRAAANHAWYRRTFKQYPVTRKRLIPFLW